MVNNNTPFPAAASVPGLPESPLAMAWLNTTGQLVAMNRSFADLLGQPATALQACRWQELTHPDDLGPELVQITRVISGLCGSYGLRKRVLGPAGEWRWVDVAVSSSTGSAAEGSPLLLVQVVDVHAQVLQLEQLQHQVDVLQEQQRLIALLQEADPIPRLLVGRQRSPADSSAMALTVRAANPAPAATLAAAGIAVASGPLTDLPLPQVPALLQLAQDAITRAEPLTATWSPEPTGEERPMLQLEARFAQQQPEPLLVLAWRPVTLSAPDGPGASAMDLADPPAAMAPPAVDPGGMPWHQLDPLTGLLHRAALFTTLEQLLEQRRRGDRIALVLCDLDQMQRLNRQFGRANGDRVLQTLAIRMRASTRDDDLLARLGGDELLVVLRDVRQLEVAIEVADKIRQVAREPIPLEGCSEVCFEPSISVGVTLLEEGEALDGALIRADAAIYAAKASGGNQVIVMPTAGRSASIRLGTGAIRHDQRATSHSL